MDEVQKLLQQVRILEQAASGKSGEARAALQRRAAEIKMEIIKLLPQRGQQQGQESKIPDPDNYFSGDYLTQQQRDYFNNLTPEMESYFATPKIQNFDNAPSAPKQPAPAETKQKDPFDDWEYRRRVLNALGIPC